MGVELQASEGSHTRRYEAPLCHLIVGRHTGHRRVQEERWRKAKKGSQCSGRREVLAYCWRRRRGKLWQLDRDFHHRDAEQPLYRGWEQLLHLCNQGRFGKGGGRGHMEVYMRQLRPEVKPERDEEAVKKRKQEKKKISAEAKARKKEMRRKMRQKLKGREGRQEKMKRRKQSHRASMAS